jgi:hypothetical protein
MIIYTLSMTVLLQTRVRTDLAARFKSAARAQGKSSYAVLRELAEKYAGEAGHGAFACNRYPERFALPAPARFKEQLRLRVRRRHDCLSGRRVLDCGEKAVGRRGNCQ